MVAEVDIREVNETGRLTIDLANPITSRSISADPSKPLPVLIKTNFVAGVHVPGDVRIIAPQEQTVAIVSQQWTKQHRQSKFLHGSMSVESAARNG